MFAQHSGHLSSGCLQQLECIKMDHNQQFGCADSFTACQAATGHVTPWSNEQIEDQCGRPQTDKWHHSVQQGTEEL